MLRPEGGTNEEFPLHEAPNGLHFYSALQVYQHCHLLEILWQQFFETATSAFNTEDEGSIFP
jgi:hypothetical protein